MARLSHSQVLVGGCRTTTPSVPAKMVGGLVNPKVQAKATMIFLLFVYPDLEKRCELVSKIQIQIGLTRINIVHPAYHFHFVGC